MTGKELANKIPAHYRKEILELNLVAKAVAVTYNESMAYLLIIYKDYINPDERTDCNLCCARVLDQFKKMLPYFIELEKDNRMLDQL